MSGEYINENFKSLSIDSIPKNKTNSTEFQSLDSFDSQTGSSKKTDLVNYEALKMIGHGSFGAVFQATVVDTNEVVAIKKVQQDRKFKNRELQIMRLLNKHPHPYIVSMKHYFVSKGSGSKSEDIYLNLVLEFIPDTLYAILKLYSRAKDYMPITSVKIYMYQLARALAHIHGLGICHRDIKPQNLLIDPSKHLLKLCDFGSAKVLVEGEPNVAYICSRYYRAPELVFGRTDYTFPVDVWSMGCVIAELFTGSPIFPGSSSVDQLVEIIKVLGTPNKEELKKLNTDYQEFKFPTIRGTPWSNLVKGHVPPEGIDLLSKVLVYTPSQRVTAIEACGLPFFDDIRDPATLLPDGSGNHLPSELFEFTQEELSKCSPEFIPLLHRRNVNDENKIDNQMDTNDN